jgi:hypothetical protein
MAQVNPNEVFAPTERPLGGWLKVGWVGGIPIHMTNGGFTVSQSPKYTNYMYTPPKGWKQKTGHSRGTKETSWTISGEYSIESLNLIDFLHPSIRGQVFTVRIQQGSKAEILPYAMLESCSFQAAPNSIVSVTLSGKSVFPVTLQQARPLTFLHHPIPGWCTGRPLSYIRNWSISHQVSLSPNWGNNQSPRPIYYRAGESEYQMQISTSAVYREFDEISLGISNFMLIQGIVTERGLTLGGKDPKAYRVSITNLDLNKDAYTEAAFATLADPEMLVPDAWPVGF